VATVVAGFALPGCDASGEQGDGPGPSPESSKTVTVPLGGNAYLTSGGGADEVTEDGITTWEKKESTFSVFVKLREPTTLTPRLRARVPGGGDSTVQLSVGGYEDELTISSSDYVTLAFEETEIEEGGYVRFDLTGVEKSGDAFADATDLVLEVPPGTSVRSVQSSEDNNFYWSRRGPSVHLRYDVPAVDVEWVHSAITVPEGMDPVGAYYMANGFDEGYFGMQVNSEDERRILFSVWSPYDTDDPSSIPDSQRVQLLAKGEDVTTGKFGNEGSGGQSYLEYPWTAGDTYRFMTRARPDGEGNTTYTAYFRPPDAQWRLIAKFKRPQTDTWYDGWYSFLENFSPSMGYTERKAYYHDHWVRDTEGSWHAVRQATFTGDATARSGARADFAGGVEDNSLYLRHCGFFDDSVPLDQDFSYTGADAQPPSINFDTLPEGQS
jgi:hypothetical protein